MLGINVLWMIFVDSVLFNTLVMATRMVTDASHCGIVTNYKVLVPSSGTLLDGCETNLCGTPSELRKLARKT